MKIGLKYYYLLSYSLFALLVSSYNSQAQQPNILWITIEDTSPEYIGCYGNTIVSTPHIDALAKEGIRFTNAFSTNTVCAPSRHCLITGVRTAENGTGNHRSYYHIDSQVMGFPTYLKNSGFYTSNNNKTDYNISNEQTFKLQNWHESSHKAGYWNRAINQRFFSVFNIFTSHQSRTMTESYAWYEKNILPLLQEEQIIKAQDVDLPPFYHDSDSMRKHMARLYNCMNLTDLEVGKVISRLKKEGQWENTIIFLFGDHGQGMPNFKTHSSRLGYQVPFIVRIPQKYQQLSSHRPGSTSDELITFEDLAPTVLSITGQAIPAYMKGRIFMGKFAEERKDYFWGNRDNTDEVIDMARTVIAGDFVYTRNYYPHWSVLQRHHYFDKGEIVQQIRADFKGNNLNENQQALLTAPRSTEELYNRKSDRWETLNLVNEKSYQDMLQKMRGLNKQKMTAYQDLGLLPEAVIAQINQSNILTSWKVHEYKFQNYLEIAEMVGRGPSFLNQQYRLFNNQDSVARYWAAIGLRNQKTEVMDQNKVEKIFESEKSILVKIEIAAILLYHYHSEMAMKWLAQQALHRNAYLSRQALMQLANYPNLPKNIISLLKKNKNKITQQLQKELSYEVKVALNAIILE